MSEDRGLTHRALERAPSITKRPKPAPKRRISVEKYPQPGFLVRGGGGLGLHRDGRAFGFFLGRRDPLRERGERHRRLGEEDEVPGLLFAGRGRRARLRGRRLSSGQRLSTLLSGRQDGSRNLDLHGVGCIDGIEMLGGGANIDEHLGGGGGDPGACHDPLGV